LWKENKQIEKIRRNMRRQVLDTRDCFATYSQFVQTLREERVRIETDHSNQLYDYLSFSKRRLRIYGIAIRHRLEQTKKQLADWNSELEGVIQRTYHTKTHEELNRITQWVTGERSELDKMRMEVGEMEMEFQALQPDEDDYKMKVPVPLIGATLSARRYVGYCYFVVLTFFTLFASGALESVSFIEVDPLGLEAVLPFGITLAVLILLLYQAFLLGRRRKLFAPIVKDEMLLAEKLKVPVLRMFDRAESFNDFLLLSLPLVMLLIIDYVIGSRLLYLERHSTPLLATFGAVVALLGLALITFLLFPPKPKYSRKSPRNARFHTSNRVSS